MTEQRKNFPEFYLTRPQSCPYLPNRMERKLFTHLGRDKNPGHFDLLHQDGFRRSQTIAYRPHCEGCTACISVRIRVDEFSPSKSQKRVWRFNKDVTSTRVAAVSSAEQYSLFQAYVEERHKDGGMTDMSVFDYQSMVEDSVVDSFMIEYRVPRVPNPLEPELPFPLSSSRPATQLIGAALCDGLSDGLSLVYSFFDPDLKKRSLGTFIILETITRAQALGLAYVYLGYWVKGSPKMDYKAKFLPQDHLIDGRWQWVDKVGDESIIHSD